MVHRHLAHQLHYDFRIEAGGVLKSWAIPKGPSMNPRDKRLAIMVEDHPLDYKDFKGVIPEGYGAGIVEIWDRGIYEVENKQDHRDDESLMRMALAAGHVSVILKGKKLKGQFALVRTGIKDADSWLLIKHRDHYAVKGKYECDKLTPASSPINKELEKRKRNVRKGKEKK